MENPPRPRRKVPRWLVVTLAIVASCYAVYKIRPPNNFDPFCSYDLTCRLNVTIEVGGRQYSSQIAHQESRSRRWIAVMNSAGCLPSYGTAIPFRLADDRVVFLRGRICEKARRQFVNSTQEFYDAKFGPAMSEHRKVDLTQYCTGIEKDKPQRQRFLDGFVIDNADRPARWAGFEMGDDLPPPGGTVRIVSAVAEAADTWPTDKIDSVAPGVFKTTFKYKQWSESPDAFLPFARHKTSTFQAEHY